MHSQSNDSPIFVLNRTSEVQITRFIRINIYQITIAPKSKEKVL